ncbi:hypothetical protein [Paraburkholderia youngii]|uniref:hypothetical protein n=1 Tax=Paraburkholderia youngii TaxID=2782701 RepID=UPI0020CCF013|nr:hypothetical protein [Paraburkholderia youngii]
MKESLLSRTKRSRGASYDAAGRCAGVGAGERNTNHGTDVVRVAPRGERKGMAVPGDGKNAEGWSSEDKFAVVLQTATLNAAEVAEYCRRKGLYLEQVAAWRASCVAANANAAEQAREQRQQPKEDKQRIKQLEKELQHKEKTLAEAAALLVLRKKA